MFLRESHWTYSGEGEGKGEVVTWLRWKICKVYRGKGVKKQRSASKMKIGLTDEKMDQKRFLRKIPIFFSQPDISEIFCTSNYKKLCNLVQ